MKIMLDAKGRITVPKRLRKAMGLVPGQPLEIQMIGGLLEIHGTGVPMDLPSVHGSPVEVSRIRPPRLTATMVRDTLDGVRR